MFLLLMKLTLTLESTHKESNRIEKLDAGMQNIFCFAFQRQQTSRPAARQSFKLMRVL
ncbi:hypothetical protein XNW1_3510002 [Xenorhabdus nematophila str. Websteri]|nr:hypothetical protein XNW1_1230002 [Xenorhabdus nematophila str. Websteri]CEF31417.1 hypothetical protein XNW1_3510002 [Xenorhabdus nematophila str. Websteri]